MMQVVPCTGCGTIHGTPTGTVRAQVTLSLSRHCKHCRRSHDETETLFFHDVDCAQRYFALNVDPLLKFEQQLRARPDYGSSAPAA